MCFKIRIEGNSGDFVIEPALDFFARLFGGASPDLETEFRDAMSYMKTNRRDLSQLAMEYYKATVGGVVQPIAGVNLLGRESWIAQPRAIEITPDEAHGVVLEMVTGKRTRNDWIYKAGAPLPWGQTYVDNLLTHYRQSGEVHRLDDEPIYQLMDFNFADRQFKFTCGQSSYYRHMNNCELLHFEFARARMRRLNKKRWWSKSSLKRKDFPLRSALDVFTFDNRCVGIGISTIFIRKWPGQAKFLKHKRTKEMAEGMGTEHVIPAGTFQPRRLMPPQNDPDFSIYRNILRELGEELLGRAEMQHVKQELDDVTQQPRVELYHELFLEGKAKLFFLGWGLDPLTTKAEFLTAMVVNMAEKDKRVAEGKFEDCWEGVHVEEEFVEKEVSAFVQGRFTQPAGAGCAKLAWQHRDQLLNSVG